MAIEIVYQPSDLSLDDFERVDRACFPDEPLPRDSLAGRSAGDFWAAFDGATLRGYAFLDHAQGLGWLRRIGVSPAHRRRGIGSRLLQAAIAHCEGLGLPKIMLYRMSDNEAARRLYVTHGFVEVGSAYQYIWQVGAAPKDSADPLEAVEMRTVDPAILPALPEEWSDLAAKHDPPSNYVLVFRDPEGKVRGYCRLNPSFPGCFPFVLDRPARDLQSALASLRAYLDPKIPTLKLTCSSDALAAACDDHGLDVNYRLCKMMRGADAG